MLTPLKTLNCPVWVRNASVNYCFCLRYQLKLPARSDNFSSPPPQKMCLNTRKWKTYAPASFPKSSWIDFGSASKFCFVTSGPGPAALTNGNLISAVYQDILQTNIGPPVGSLKLKWSPLMQHAYKPKTSCSPWRSGSSQVTVSTLANEMMLRYVLMTQPIVTKYDRIPTILSRRIG